MKINNEEWVSKELKLTDFEKKLKKLGLSEKDFVNSYDNGDYCYEEDGVEYLLNSEGKLRCKGSSVYSFNNGDCSYKKDGVYYLLNSKNELRCKGDWVHSYLNGDCEYEEDGVYYLLNSEGKLRCEGDWVDSYDNGDYMYKKDGVEYDYIKKEKCWEVNGVKYYKK